MKEIVRSSGGGRSKKSKKSKDVGDGSRGSGGLKKSKDVGDVSRGSGGLKKSKDVGDGSRVCDVLKKSKDVGERFNFFDFMMKSKDPVNGCRGGSLSSSFKRKVSITESSSSSLYFYYPEDWMVVQKMYGLTTEGELVGLVESTRLKDDEIVSPNLRFTYGVEPYNRDSDPRIGSLAIQKENVLNMAQATDRASLLKMPPLSRRRLPEGSSLPTPWRKPELKPVVVPNQEEMWRKRYEMWEKQEDKLLHARDLRMATRALACFNLKFKTDYMVEQVLGSQKIDLGTGGYYHCNFIACSKKGSQKPLFFAEVEHAITVILCCILDGDDVRRGCRFCGNEFVHPSEEGLLSLGGN